MDGRAKSSQVGKSRKKAVFAPQFAWCRGIHLHAVPGSPLATANQSLPARISPIGASLYTGGFRQGGFHPSFGFILRADPVARCLPAARTSRRANPIACNPVSCLAHKKNPPTHAAGGICRVYSVLLLFETPFPREIHRGACISLEQPVSLHVMAMSIWKLGPGDIVSSGSHGKCRHYTGLRYSTMATPPCFNN